MGIVNLCADSFSGDGILDPDLAVEHSLRLVSEGAEIIDVGAESARTNRGPMEWQEEADRILEFASRWHCRCNERFPSAEKPLLSINTWRPEVVSAVLPARFDLLNDIGALPTPENARLCAEAGVALLIMHSVGQPKAKHTHVIHSDIMQTLVEFFETKLQEAIAAGLSRDAIVIDPGIDFAKQRADNLTIYQELEQLHRFERPILLPVSRKTVIGEVLNIPDAARRDAGTVACIVQGIQRGAQIFRVHNVRAARNAVEVCTALNAAA